MVSQGKPAPDLFLLCAERLNASPSNCLVVEDSIYGVMAAQAAGMNVVGFCGGSHCQAGHADRLLGLGCMEAFACIAELTRFLKDICCR
jgi:beta-phosphoglucomutase-like phosphatase (HAD superfamily)